MTIQIVSVSSDPFRRRQEYRRHVTHPWPPEGGPASRIILKRKAPGESEPVKRVRFLENVTVIL